MPSLLPGGQAKPVSPRLKPLTALAVLSLAGLCALPLYSARAQEVPINTQPLLPPKATKPSGATDGTPPITTSPITNSPVGRTAPIGIIEPIGIINPVATGIVPSGVSVLQYRYDNGRTGVYNVETTLHPPTTPATAGGVSQTTFGKLYSRALDGPSYSQPLYYQSLSITNPFTNRTSTHNVIFVTTNNNSVYAFDADDNTGSNGSPLWRANFNSVANSIGPTNGSDITDIFGLPQADIQPLIGIVGTPVIDGPNKILYVVVRTTEGGGYAHRLHAIDITTGLEKSFSPQLVGQQTDVFGDVSPVIVPGTGDDPYDANNIFFDATTQNQRAALSLINGSVYVAYGSFDNSPPYHGWVFTYNAATLSPQGIFCTTPNASNSFIPGDPVTTGGIDMSGVGPAYDAPTDTSVTTAGLYFSTGLGVFDSNSDYGESVLKLNQKLTGTPPTFPYQSVPQVLPRFSVVSSFTPYNFDSFLNAFGLDLGVGGVALLPNNVINNHPHAMITAGTEGKVYLLDRDNLGGYNPFADTGAIATFPSPTLLGPAYGVPAVYTDNNNVTTVYYHAAGDVLRPFTISSGTPYLNPATTGNAQFGFPGAMPVISANNGTNGIVWELEGAATQDPTGGRANIAPTAVLHAYDASNVQRVLFDSSANGGGANSIGDYVKFTQPLVANGKVYVTAGSPSAFDPGGAVTASGGNLVVFGPLTKAPATQGYHYLLTGPLQGGYVPANLTNYYSLTAVDSNFQPVNVTTANVHLTLTDQFTSRVLSLGDVTFSNQSSVIFSRAISTPGSYSVQARDGSGNTSQTNFGFQPTLSVFGSGGFGFFGGSSFDHYNLRVPPAAKNGATTTVTITPVDYRGIPITYNSFVTIYDTLPSGVQDYAPGSGFAYEFQVNFAAYPTAGGSGTYPVSFFGPGKHIVVVEDITGASSTAVVNVIP